MFKVEVLIEHPVQALDRGFSYLSKKPVLTGIRVQVPFNHRQVVGYVLSVEEIQLTQKELEERDGFKYSYVQDDIMPTYCMLPGNAARYFKTFYTQNGWY